MATDLNDFMPNVTTQDTKKRFLVHTELVPYLSDPGSSLVCEDIGKFIEGLTGWVNCSNHKVCRLFLRQESKTVHPFFADDNPTH